MMITLFHVMSYQNTNEDIKSVFTSARSALSQGGVFLLDAWNGSIVLTDPTDVRIKAAEDDQYRLVRFCRPEMHDETMSLKYIISDKGSNQVRVINEVHRMRYFPARKWKNYMNRYVLI